MSTVSYQQCEGRGYTTTHEPKMLGRASNGESVYSRFTAPINRRCETCKGRRVVEQEAGQPAPSDVQTLDISITFGGMVVDAPGFTATSSSGLSPGRSLTSWRLTRSTATTSSAIRG